MKNEMAVGVVAVRNKPTIDEILAAVFVQWWSWARVQVKFVPADDPRIKMGKEVMLLGMGGGDFDLRSFYENGHRPQDECISTLVAFFFHKAEDPYLKLLLDAVLADDINGTSHRVAQLLGIGELHQMYASRMSGAAIMQVVSKAAAKFYRKQQAEAKKKQPEKKKELARTA